MGKETKALLILVSHFLLSSVIKRKLPKNNLINLLHIPQIDTTSVNRLHLKLEIKGLSRWSDILLSSLRQLWEKEPLGSHSREECQLLDSWNLSSQPKNEWVKSNTGMRGHTTERSEKSSSTCAQSVSATSTRSLHVVSVRTTSVCPVCGVSSGKASKGCPERMG